MEQNLWLAADHFSFCHWKLGGTVKKTPCIYWSYWNGGASVHQPIVGRVVAGLDIWAVASLFQPRLSNLPSSGFKTQKDSTASISIGNILLQKVLRDKIKTLSGPCLAFLDWPSWSIKQSISKIFWKAAFKSQEHLSQENRREIVQLIKDLKPLCQRGEAVSSSCRAPPGSPRSVAGTPWI